MINIHTYKVYYVKVATYIAIKNLSNIFKLCYSNLRVFQVFIYLIIGIIFSALKTYETITIVLVLEKKVIFCSLVLYGELLTFLLSISFIIYTNLLNKLRTKDLCKSFRNFDQRTVLETLSQVFFSLYTLLFVNAAQICNTPL